MNVPPELSPAAWIKLADEDFGVAYDLAGLDTNRYHAICFHCQQAVEKYLKALLAAAAEPVPWSHDLAALLQAVQTIHGDAPVAVDELIWLTGFAGRGRYPGFAPPASRQAADRALAAAKAIRTFCRESMPESSA